MISREYSRLQKKLLFWNEEMPLPPCEDKKTLAEQFNLFFIMKIEKIMEGLVPTNTHLFNPVYIESEMEQQESFMSSGLSP